MVEVLLRVEALLASPLRGPAQQVGPAARQRRCPWSPGRHTWQRSCPCWQGAGPRGWSQRSPWLRKPGAHAALSTDALRRRGRAASDAPGRETRGATRGGADWDKRTGAFGHRRAWCCAKEAIALPHAQSPHRNRPQPAPALSGPIALQTNGSLRSGKLADRAAHPPTCPRGLGRMRRGPARKPGREDPPRTLM